jgi:hypothetical protein
MTISRGAIDLMFTYGFNFHFKLERNSKLRMEIEEDLNRNHELGEFLDGIIFSPDGTRCTLADRTTITAESASELAPLSLPVDLGLDPQGDNSTTTRIDENDEGLVLVSTSNIKPQDILCVRGHGGIHNAANMMFRTVISSNKSQFDSLTTNKEKQSFSTNLFSQLRDEGHRFLRPAEGGHYEVLDFTKSVHKVRLALQSCRSGAGKNVASKPASNVTELLPTEDKIFDDVARSSIRQILARQEFVEAIQRNWGEDTASKSQQFEEYVIQRCRKAAFRGLSVEEFSARLLQILLKEVEENK